MQIFVCLFCSPCGSHIPRRNKLVTEDFPGDGDRPQTDIEQLLEQLVEEYRFSLVQLKISSLTHQFLHHYKVLEKH
ncbi:hypothetical protein DPX16_3307 [Anabarilius grahami]|uniref:Uncharacterized protein n=1 Tax=Anabarilius grahami TaxID=495550 RepID=A0A3N0XL96_ANAGA|nr:hypothetical protein DPX16_3307 [Anabarilius grahami]